MWIWQDLGPREDTRPMGELCLFPFELSLLLHCVTFDKFCSLSRALTNVLPQCLLTAASSADTQMPQTSQLLRKGPSVFPGMRCCQGPSPPSAQARMDEMLVGKVSETKPLTPLAGSFHQRLNSWGRFSSFSLVKETATNIAVGKSLLENHRQLLHAVLFRR